MKVRKRRPRRRRHLRKARTALVVCQSRDGRLPSWSITRALEARGFE